MAKNSSIESSLYFAYFSGTTCIWVSTDGTFTPILTTYAEELYVVEDMVVVREIIAGNDVYSCVLLYPPMCVSKSLALIEELFL